MTDQTIHPRERDLYRERDELRAEVERLRQGQHVITLTSGAVGRTSVTVPCGCVAEVERLRAALQWLIGQAGVEIRRWPDGRLYLSHANGEYGAPVDANDLQHAEQVDQSQAREVICLTTDDED